MANLSDAFGDITVEKVGQEFIDYLKQVQGDDAQAYYKLVEVDQLERAEADEDGDLTMSFSTAGRWSYSTNIAGYLRGEWMDSRDTENKVSSNKDAYLKFVQAVIDKGGLVNISYTDSDSAMDWMGTGSFTMQAVDGEIVFADDFEEEVITIAGFAELQGETAEWALEYLYGDEVSNVYYDYVDNCKTKGVEPVEADTWYDTIYEQED